MEMEEWLLPLARTTPDEITESVLLLRDRAHALRPLVLGRAQRWKRRLQDYVRFL